MDSSGLIHETMSKNGKITPKIQILFIHSKPNIILISGNLTEMRS